MNRSSVFWIFLLIVVCGTFIVLIQMPHISVPDINTCLKSQTFQNSSETDTDQSLTSNVNGEASLVVNSVTDKSFYSSPMTIRPPAVLLWLKGGIGNQLFLYACHYALARKHDWPLYIMMRGSSSGSSIREWTVTKRDFALDQFHIPLHEWNTANESWTVVDAVSINDSMLLSGSYPLDKVVQLGGNDYCQGQGFFTGYEQELSSLLSQSGKILEEKVEDWTALIEGAEESVAVHVRRRDALAVKDSPPLSFQEEAMGRLSQRLSLRTNKSPVFFVFSDDIDYVRTNLSPPNNSSLVHYVSNPDKLGSLEEFYLMRRCKHHINSPSSFSWWTAFLSKGNEKLVYAGHHRKSTILRNRGPTEGPYNVWSYSHMYYPTNWIAIDPWKEKI